MADQWPRAAVPSRAPSVTRARYTSRHGYAAELRQDQAVLQHGQVEKVKAQPAEEVGGGVPCPAAGEGAVGPQKAVGEVVGRREAHVEAERGMVASMARISWRAWVLSEM